MPSRSTRSSTELSDVAREMVRVTRPGGLVFISWTVWYGPWGGHETAPWHYLGGRRAREQHQHARDEPRKHQHPPHDTFSFRRDPPSGTQKTNRETP